MRPVMFVVCFTLGVALMVFSGYLPKSASARHSAADPVAATSTAGDLNRMLYGQRPNPLDGRTPHESDSVVSDNAEPPEVVPEDADPNLLPSGSADDTPAEPTADVPPATEPETADGAEPPVSTPSRPSLIAEAGEGGVVWIGWNEIQLDGSASQGEGLVYDWIQISGAEDLEIRDPAAAQTGATGFRIGRKLGWADAVYEFELLVTDSHGQEALDTVQFIVKAAPNLTITPAAERRFELRDDYWLGHYEAWITNLESYESTFQIVSPVELAFTKVTGGEFDLAGGDSGEGLYAYQVTLFARGDEPTSWVEFLIDTADRIPGIVQLGVNWVEVGARKQSSPAREGQTS